MKKNRKRPIQVDENAKPINQSPNMPIGKPLYTHMAIGWFGMATAMLGGMALDIMLGFKIGFYLDVGNETRRELWRLAHSHAGGISLIHFAFAAYLLLPHVEWNWRLRIASQGITIGLIAMPVGFALGGVKVYGSDPGPGIFLVPVGGIALVVATWNVAFDSLYSLFSREKGSPN